VKWPECEDDHFPFGAEVNGGAVPPLPFVFMAWCLINQKFYLTFFFGLIPKNFDDFVPF
jgi:hypothetical protein